MIEVRPPVSQFFEANGTPLDAGYIYVGVSGANPETSPQAVYWDKDGLIPATQPIRTLQGYPARDGAVAKFYTSVRNYSITIRNKRGELVQSVLNSDSGVFDELEDEASAAGIGYDNDTSGLAATDVQGAIDELKTDVAAVESDVNDLLTSFSGLYNLLANGAFFINQREYLSGTPTVAANQYTLDRWRVVVSGQSLVYTLSPEFGLAITAPAGGLEQVIEGTFVVGGDYAITWKGTGTVTVNGINRPKGEKFTIASRTTLTVKLVGDFEMITFTRPELIGRFEYNYQTDMAYCKRYYEVMDIVFSNSPSTQYHTHSWSAYKRTSPALTTSLLSGSGAPTLNVIYLGYTSFYQLTAPSGLGTLRVYGSCEL